MYVKNSYIHLSRPRIDYRPLREMDAGLMKKLSYYRDNREEFEFLLSRYGDAVRSGTLVSADVRPVGSEIGLGLFAREAVSKDDLAGEYTGLVREAREIKPEDIDEDGHYPDDWAWDYPVEIPGFPPLEIDAREAGNVLRFVNHSMNPNLRPDHFLLDNGWVLIFIADRDIAPGEELTIDYGEAYWSGEFRELVLREDEMSFYDSSGGSICFKKA